MFALKNHRNKKLHYLNKCSCIETDLILIRYLTPTIMDDNNRIHYLLPECKMGLMLAEIEEIILAFVYFSKDSQPQGGWYRPRLLPHSFSLN